MSRITETEDLVNGLLEHVKTTEPGVITTKSAQEFHSLMYNMEELHSILKDRFRNNSFWRQAMGMKNNKAA